MRKETIFCNEASDRSLQQCEVDHNEQSAQKKVGALRHGGNVMFLACADETVKVIDSFNCIIKEMSIQALNTHCPCCAGEMTMANALLVITRDPDNSSVVIERAKEKKLKLSSYQTDSNYVSSYAVLPNGRELRIPNTAEPLAEYLRKPLEESMTKPRLTEKLLMFPLVEESEEDSKHWDSNMTRIPLPLIPRELKIIKTASNPLGLPHNVEEYRKSAITQKPNIWQLSPNGIVAEMLTPLYYMVNTAKAMGPDKCDCENKMVMHGRGIRDDLLLNVETRNKRKIEGSLA